MPGHADIPSMHDVLGSRPTDEATVQAAKRAVLRRFELGLLSADEALDVLQMLGISTTPSPSVAALPALSVEQRRTALAPKEGA